MSNVNQHPSELSHRHERRSELAGHPTHEHTAQIREHHERETHNESHHREQQRFAAEQEAINIAPTVEEFQGPGPEALSHNLHHTPMSRDRAFNKTMEHIQAEMTPSERAFSKVIHNPVIEKTSELLSATIARPNALLAGSIGAFALTLAIYIFAKSVGYRLSGFEPIAAFIVGWIGGFLYDYLRVMVTGKR